jgi:anaerobic magnesium-protoporphyrin IX monomethyl ester cyclase
MADVLLTHSYHLGYDRKQARKMQPYPPLGTLYAAGLLREHGISVAVSDPMLAEPQSGLRNSLRVHQPRVVAIYEDDFNFLTKMCLTRMRALAWEMIEIARAHGARVIVHGSDATDHAADYLRYGADFVIEGEAEYTLLRVVRAISDGRFPANIPGVKYLRQTDGRETIASCAHAAPRRSFPSLPFPARDLIDFEPYRQAWKKAHGFISFNLLASRGCPFRCNWCAKPIFGDSYQLRAAEDVALEMRLLKEKYGAEHLWFADDIFGLNRHWLQDFARAVEVLHCAVPFKVQARADLLTPESVAALKRAGCAEVWMGVESGSQKILDAMDKGLRVEEVIEARSELQRQSIRACYFLQLGYPGEHWDDLSRTIGLVRETLPDDIGVSFSYPLPNTRFYARVKAQLGVKQNWADSEDLCVMFKGTYSDTFYRAIRDALHSEVELHHDPKSHPARQRELTEQWKVIASMESSCRNADPTDLSQPAAGESFLGPADPLFVPLDALALAAGDTNE